jgi:xanthine dehydrogenase accessory factor
MTIGLGPGFVAGVHADIAIETAWGDSLGAVIESGPTRPFEGEPRPIGGAGRERYVYASKAGRFQTDRRIGDCVAAGEEVATLDGDLVVAPLAGVLRGLSARGARIGNGQKIVEVDPRGDRSLCFGLGERPHRVAMGVVGALLRRGILARVPAREGQRESLHE